MVFHHFCSFSLSKSQNSPYFWCWIIRCHFIHLIKIFQPDAIFLRNTVHGFTCTKYMNDMFLIRFLILLFKIKDIAALAGVSAGTVDRVIHNRGKVSEKNRLFPLSAKGRLFQPFCFSASAVRALSAATWCPLSLRPSTSAPTKS